MREYDDTKFLEATTSDELRQKAWNLMIIALGSDSTATFSFEPDDGEEMEKLLDQIRV